MAHPQQLQFVRSVSRALSDSYRDLRILEIGSYDVNGEVRKVFEGSSYVGVDLTEGPGVDVVCEGGTLDHPDASYELSISCECFEHNPQWVETLRNMHRMTRQGGVVLVTCATTGQLEHGTTRTSPKSSPGTQSVGWDYYLNLTEKDFRRSLTLDELFEQYFFIKNPYVCDLYFVGIKKGAPRLFDVDLPALKARALEDQKKLHEEMLVSQGGLSLRQQLVRMAFFPVRLASALPDRTYQGFAHYYVKLLGLPGKVIRVLVGKA
ncbi:hypothetical protein GCM10027046_28220 [Uliginosibacterium flavum]|uniref:Class I SAM-dependent methyltransferase n=1 Tax=Uliginosibacterium flavum TaxID=1396831 RepID=A0ABV2TGV5_9RHOO